MADPLEDAFRFASVGMQEAELLVADLGWRLGLPPALVWLALGLLVLAAARRLVLRGRSRRESCRWRRIGRRTPKLQAWRCRACGAEAYSSTGKPPLDCKRGLRPERL